MLIIILIILVLVLCFMRYEHCKAKREFRRMAFRADTNLTRSYTGRWW